MNKSRISINLSISCITLYLFITIISPRFVGFISDSVFIIMFIFFAILFIPAIVLSIISYRDESKSSQSTKQSKCAFALSIVLSVLISGLIYSELKHNQNLRSEAFSAGTKAYINSICVSLAMYKLDCHKYPSQKLGFSALTKNSDGECWNGPYLVEPSDFVDLWQNPIIYSINDNQIAVISAGPDDKIGTKDDIQCN